MANPKLKIAESKNAEETALDQIQTNWHNWHGPNGAPWVPYNGPTTPWSNTVSQSLDRGRYIVKTESPLPLWRRILRKIQSLWS